MIRWEQSGFCPFLPVKHSGDDIMLWGWKMARTEKINNKKLDTGAELHANLFKTKGKISATLIPAKSTFSLLKQTKKKTFENKLSFSFQSAGRAAVSRLRRSKTGPISNLRCSRKTKIWVELSKQSSAPQQTQDLCDCLWRIPAARPVVAKPTFSLHLHPRSVPLTESEAFASAPPHLSVVSEWKPHCAILSSHTFPWLWSTNRTLTPRSLCFKLSPRFPLQLSNQVSLPLPLLPPTLLWEERAEPHPASSPVPPAASR